jgi:hypothetical protein
MRFVSGEKETDATTAADYTSSSSSSSSSSSASEWRKIQLEKLEMKFKQPSMTVQNDEDLQPMWKEMESRVTRRRPRTIEEMGGRTGRVNVKKTDEEMWLQEGLYEEETSSKSTK